MEIQERHIWLVFGLGLLGFLVITTPGWQEVLGFDLGAIGISGIEKYIPAAILLGFMGALVGFAILASGKEEGGEEE